MTKQICAHWFLQRKADEIVKRLVPDGVITPEVRLKGNQTVSGEDFPAVSKAAWEVRFNLADSANVDAIVPILNQAMLQLHRRYDLDLSTSTYVTVAEPKHRPVGPKNPVEPMLPKWPSVAAGSPKRINGSARITPAKACRSRFKHARSPSRQRQPSTTALMFAAFDAPAAWMRFGFHRHRPIVSAAI